MCAFRKFIKFSEVKIDNIQKGAFNKLTIDVLVVSNLHVSSKQRVFKGAIIMWYIDFIIGSDSKLYIYNSSVSIS